GKITFGAKRTVIVPDVVYDVVTSQIGQDAGAFDWVRHGHRIAHHLDPQVTPRLYDQLDRFGMGPTHDDYVRSPCFRHDLSFEPAAVHRFQIGHYRYVRKA